jgi:hypothetical protein
MDSSTNADTQRWTCPYCGKEQPTSGEWFCQFCDMEYHVKHDPRKVRIRPPPKRRDPSKSRFLRKATLAYVLASLVGFGFAFIWGHSAFITTLISTTISIPTGMLAAVVLYLPVRKTMKGGYAAIGVITIGSAILGEYICTVLISVYFYGVPAGWEAMKYAFINFFYFWEPSAYAGTIGFGVIGMVCGMFLYWRIPKYSTYFSGSFGPRSRG